MRASTGSCVSTRPAGAGASRRQCNAPHMRSDPPDLAVASPAPTPLAGPCSSPPLAAHSPTQARRRRGRRASGKRIFLLLMRVCLCSSRESCLLGAKVLYARLFTDTVCVCVVWMKTAALCSALVLLLALDLTGERGSGSVEAIAANARLCGGAPALYAAGGPRSHRPQQRHVEASSACCCARALCPGRGAERTRC